MTQKRLAVAGGTLLALSGIANTILGIQTGILIYEPYPGGKLGDVGIVAGLVAFVIGLAIIFLVSPLYVQKSRKALVWGGILTIILGHLGAIAGALFIGTAGMILCYIAGIWVLITVKKKPATLDTTKTSSQ